MVRGEQRIMHPKGKIASPKWERWSRNRDTRMRPAGTVWCPHCGMVPIIPEAQACRKCRLKLAKSNFLQRRQQRMSSKRSAKQAIQRELF